jgi:hypothetical protein
VTYYEYSKLIAGAYKAFCQRPVARTNDDRKKQRKEHHEAVTALRAQYEKSNRPKRRRKVS